MTEIEDLHSRYGEANQIHAMLIECGHTAAADVVAARMGVIRDALALLGVDIECEGEEATISPESAKWSEPDARGPEGEGARTDRPPLRPEVLERLRENARKARAAKAARAREA